MSELVAQQRQRLSPFVAIARVRQASHWRLARHTHRDYTQLLYVAAGTMEVTIAGRTVRGAAGDVLCYPARVPHAERNTADAPLDLLYLGFGGRLNALARELPLHRPDASGRIRVLLDWMLERSPATHQADRLAQQALLLAVLAEHAAPLGAAQPDLPAQVRAYVRRHLADPITLDDLARATGLSRYRFAHAFRTAAGQAPMHFVRRLRAEAARGMLLTSDAPLRTVAGATGFADAFHLSRTLRRLLGSSPSALRRR